MATKPTKIVRGKRLRVTRLGPCGELPEAEEECAQVVTRGFVSVEMSPENEEGDEITQQVADGSLCVDLQSPHEFKRWTLSIELCEVDPDLVSMLTRVSLETDADGDTVGFRSRKGVIEEQFALELWVGVGEDECENGQEYGYLLFPWVAGGTFDSLTVENDAATLTIENAFTRGGGEWGVGPYDVVPDAMGDPEQLGDPMESDEHHLQRTTTIAPPDAQAGCQDMPTYTL